MSCLFHLPISDTRYVLVGDRHFRLNHEEAYWDVWPIKNNVWSEDFIIMGSNLRLHVDQRKWIVALALVTCRPYVLLLTAICDSRSLDIWCVSMGINEVDLVLSLYQWTCCLPFPPPRVRLSYIMTAACLNLNQLHDSFTVMLPMHQLLPNNIQYAKSSTAAALQSQSLRKLTSLDGHRIRMTGCGRYLGMAIKWTLAYLGT